MKYEWTYQKLGDFTYNVLPEAQIKPFLLEWVKQEWEVDHAEAPDQPWTVEWLSLLPRMEFELKRLRLEIIQPRTDLMNYKSDTDNFVESLLERAAEREESLLRGVSTEPLLVNGSNMELMDGYTRYVILKKHHQKEVFAYVGDVL